MVNILKIVIKKLIGINNALRIQRAYYRTCYRVCRKNRKRSEKTKKSILRKFSVPNKHTFFGYYDKNPFCKNNIFVLATVAPFINRSPNENDKLIIGYFKWDKNNTFHPIGKTTTWCWQQSCRLQWLPPNEDVLVIYNKLVNNRYGSIVQNIKTKKIVSKHSVAIYDIDKKGENALTLNFSRLGRLRPGYGYVNIPDDTLHQLTPEHDGVWIYNLLKREKKLLFSLKFLSKLDPLPSMESAEHYINHLSFCPCGNRFMFFHLWLKKIKRYSRLITADIKGKEIHILNNEGMVSHYTWKTCNDLLVYSYHKDTGTNYHTYNDINGEKSVFAKDILKEDGHPSFSPNGNLITDTYPDKYGERKLLLLRSDNELFEIGRFYSPLKYQGETRCDLHPRWDRLGQKICFDSVHEGMRKMYILEMGIFSHSFG